LTIGIGHGVRGEKSRCWPQENFAKLIKLLVEQLNAVVVLFGSDYDLDSAKNIIGLINQTTTIKKIVNLTGKTSVTEFGACVKKCDLYISNDTGGMHIAAVSGTKVIGLFGPTDPKYWGPYGDNSYVIQGKAECSPCSYTKMKHCKSNVCMQNISVEEVFEKAKWIFHKY